MKTWNSPWGDFELAREPYDRDPALQAWSAADALLARHALETPEKKDTPYVVFNDAFGALTVVLRSQGRYVIQVSDSALSQRCTLVNLDANNLDNAPLQLLDSLTVPVLKPESPPPVVLLRLPKTLALLEYQLHQVRQFAPLGTVVAASAMAKDIHTSTLETFEALLGPTTSSLAESKARLILSTLTDQAVAKNPYPTQWHLPSLHLHLVNHAAVFSREGLDEGTRLLLQHFPKIGPEIRTLVDLGCGNGILGLVAAQRSGRIEIFCVDESFMATCSARDSFRASEMGGRAQFLTGDGLEDFEAQSVDLILCNPPFHFQNAQSLEAAYSMFDDAKRVLRPGGELWVVANRHLGHHKALAERFPQVRTAALTDKFIVLRAVMAISPE
ncbi:MAG: methyltransferase [Spirochaetales bacterium]